MRSPQPYFKVLDRGAEHVDDRVQRVVVKRHFHLHVGEGGHGVGVALVPGCELFCGRVHDAGDPEALNMGRFSHSTYVDGGHVMANVPINTVQFQRSKDWHRGEDADQFDHVQDDYAGET